MEIIENHSILWDLFMELNVMAPVEGVFLLSLPRSGAFSSRSGGSKNLSEKAPVRKDGESL